MQERAEPRAGCSRRRVLRGLAAAVAAPVFLPAGVLGREGRVAPSNRITLGCIGVGNRGSADMNAFMSFAQVQVLAVCDVVQAHRERAKAAVDKRYGSRDCAAYNDFRQLLARPDIDAVMIGTPDHWHAIPAILACRAGKDVYCEKPLSLTIREGRLMSDAARKYQRVFSCGSQRVRGDTGTLADQVDAGCAGQVREVYIDIGPPPLACDLGGQPAPPGMDWNLWLGPAPWAPYHPYRCSAALEVSRRGWRSWYDYSGGMMTDWGGHRFGAVLYALGLEETGPVRVIPPDGREHRQLTYVFANGVRMYHGPPPREYATRSDVVFVGTDGWLPGHGAAPRRRSTLRTYQGQGGIYGDFLHCVKTRQRPFQDVEYAHRTATVCHLGNIAYLLKRPLRWDPVREDFVDDAEASRLLDRPKREPWCL